MMMSIVKRHLFLFLLLLFAHSLRVQISKMLIALSIKLRDYNEDLNFQGDIWAETTMFGLCWKYLALMEGKVYDITEWANCQKGALSHLQPNSHIVQYRIVLGGQQVCFIFNESFNFSRYLIEKKKTC